MTIIEVLSLASEMAVAEYTSLLVRINSSFVSLALVVSADVRISGEVIG